METGRRQKAGLWCLRNFQTAILAVAMAFARETPRVHFNAIEPGLNPTTGLGGSDVGAFVRSLYRFHHSDPRATTHALPQDLEPSEARVITKIMTDASGQAGVYYDEGGRSMQGSASMPFERKASHRSMARVGWAADRALGRIQSAGSILANRPGDG